MVNYKMLKESIEDGLSYIKEQQEKNRPIIDALTKVLINKLPEADLTFKEALSFYHMLMEQETNSILVITKMQEILNYTKENNNY